MEGEIRSDVVSQTNEGSMEKRSWIVEIKEDLANMESNSHEREEAAHEGKIKTIYKLPPSISRNFDRHDYEPHIVSFGPYHHGHGSCKKTEQIKRDVVLCSLSRWNTKIDDYVDELRKVVQELKDAYDQLDPKWQGDDDAFLQLMIYDSCFFLEIYRGNLYKRSPAWSIDGIGKEELTEKYNHDILLLENQIPMLALEKLYAVQTNKSLEEIVPQIQEAQEYLHESILMAISSRNTMLSKKKDVYFHTLDLYRHGLLSRERRAQRTWDISVLNRRFESFMDKVYDDNYDIESPMEQIPCCLKNRTFRLLIQCLLAPVVLFHWLGLMIYIWTPEGVKYLFGIRSWFDFRMSSIPSATELDKVGIGFIPSKTTSLKDLSFGHRNLRLPQIYVDSTTKSRFLNIIALEQLSYYRETKVCSYIYFMSRLLQSAEDVQRLRSHLIINGPLPANEIAELFNSLMKDIAQNRDFFFAVQYRQEAGKLAKSFYYRINNPLQNDLWQNYLRSPLGIVSLIVAFFLFSLTTIQTVYTVLSYYNSN